MVIPDLRGPDAFESPWLRVVYQNGQKCIVAPTSVIVNEYLPGEENEQLRKSFVSRLDDIGKAREAVYGDIDAVASAEVDAVDDLIETAPTTMAGLMSFLIYLAKARRRDPELFCEHHLEPLIDGLGKAAAALS